MVPVSSGLRHDLRNIFAQHIALGCQLYVTDRTDPFTGLRRLHEGVDIVTRRGTAVTAPAEGIVTYAGHDPTLGEMAVLDHGYGVITRYGHNEAVLVREGQRVSRGDPIALVGSSGKSTGPHLHYEIRINDLAVNPSKYILE